MSKLIILITISIIGAVMSQNFLAEIPTISQKITLSPGKPFEITNPLFFKVKISCLISAQDSTDSVFGKLSKGSATINGKDVPKEGLTMDVYNGDKFLLTAEKFTTASLTNNGEHEVIADCSLGYEGNDYNILLSENGDISISQKITLSPGKPFEITNPLFFKVKISCLMSSQDESDSVFGKLSKGSATINGKDVPKEGLTMDVHNGEKFLLTAEKFTTASLTNNGEHDVVGDCSLGYENSHRGDEYKTFEIKREGNLTISQKITLSPGKPFEITNPLFFKISVSCNITTTDSSDNVFGKVLKGKASLNGNPIPSDGIIVEVHNGDVFKIEAEKFTKASLTNNGSNDVVADCSVGVETQEKINYLREVIYNIDSGINGFYDS